jgi:hypothetical protein
MSDDRRGITVRGPVADEDWSWGYRVWLPGDNMPSNYLDRSIEGARKCFESYCRAQAKEGRDA